MAKCFIQMTHGLNHTFDSTEVHFHRASGQEITTLSISPKCSIRETTSTLAPEPLYCSYPMLYSLKDPSLRRQDTVPFRCHKSAVPISSASARLPLVSPSFASSFAFRAYPLSSPVSRDVSKGPYTSRTLVSSQDSHPQFEPRRQPGSYLSTGTCLGTCIGTGHVFEEAAHMGGAAA
jgi:hypothetical protein